MPRYAKELKAVEVRRLSQPGLHAVGGVPGLMLQVGEGGARSWILRTLIGRKRRSIGLGSYPLITLAEARQKAKAMREQIRDGIDPIAERRAQRAALLASQEKALTFEQAARRCHQAKQAQFRSAKHRKDWIASLERYALPKIGRMPVAEIELPQILGVLQPIWETRTETATRLRQRLEAVLTWAAVSGYRSGDNPARWEGNLKEVLPAPNKIRKRSHQRALPWQEVPAFMVELRKREGVSAEALQFSILTAARSSEVRLMQWPEIDLEAKTWTIPPERMKAGRRHIVPLSDAAIEILKRQHRHEGSPYVFTSPRGKALSDMSLSAVCRRMEVDAVPHGFRSSFKDWARNRSAYPDEVSELALAHVNSDATRAAYARDELLPQRTRLMKEWARYLKRPAKAGEVVPMRGAK
ncbi:MAG TPA: integrase arm-type DNA-binding domain-containing protein [Thiohalobacter sp.]|nr:integrase arm-type DNA-binding domain-containing protein [Thiohalobacter sp.]